MKVDTHTHRVVKLYSIWLRVKDLESTIPCAGSATDWSCVLAAISTF